MSSTASSNICPLSDVHAQLPQANACMTHILTPFSDIAMDAVCQLHAVQLSISATAKFHQLSRCQE